MTKPLWQSKTIWLNAASVLLAHLIGTDYGFDPAVVDILAGANTLLRLVTKQGLSLR